jgi:hypothetical protein
MCIYRSSIESVYYSSEKFDRIVFKIAQALSNKCADPKVKIAQSAVETCWKCLENGSIQGEDMFLEITTGFLNVISNRKVASARISGCQYLTEVAKKYQGMHSQRILSKLEDALNSSKYSSGAIRFTWKEGKKEILF